MASHLLAARAAIRRRADAAASLPTVLTRAASCCTTGPPSRALPCAASTTTWREPRAAGGAPRALHRRDPVPPAGYAGPRSGRALSLTPTRGFATVRHALAGAASAAAEPAGARRGSGATASALLAACVGAAAGAALLLSESKRAEAKAAPPKGTHAHGDCDGCDGGCKCAREQCGCMSMADAIEVAMPSVVKILLLAPTGRGYAREAGSGSGFIIDESGTVVTNHHVARPGQQVLVRLSDGSQFPGTVIGGDAHSDVSLVQIQDAGRSFPPLKLGSSTKLRVGQPIIVLGAPLGMEQSATHGIVASHIRHAADFNMTVNYGSYSMLQVDAVMLPGNSGGPVINLNGEVVGISNMIAGRPGIGMLNFAIPIDTAKPIITGVSCATPARASRSNTPDPGPA